MRTPHRRLDAHRPGLGAAQPAVRRQVEDRDAAGRDPPQRVHLADGHGDRLGRLHPPHDRHGQHPGTRERDGGPGDQRVGPAGSADADDEEYRHAEAEHPCQRRREPRARGEPPRDQATGIGLHRLRHERREIPPADRRRGSPIRDRVRRSGPRRSACGSRGARRRRRPSPPTASALTITAASITAFVPRDGSRFDLGVFAGRLHRTRLPRGGRRNRQRQEQRHEEARRTARAGPPHRVSGDRQR